ncbi:hypothetical protein BJV85_002949 [Clostridium acetobutylicum]|uniref:Uncharacterized protein n=1 Tax=Clostridium acetobutylicum (strain ATCC 824 / DSM 792 / JCM 1419 / IAM 19013 / LMG 5710 / NBRC 13948 / NRRL B-527 / VKM B-1787 / 2291 / W) TaxID=272562 RepID=Q97K64_CLOAB|nr:MULTISPECIES: hypothetical protein [Clostridium]AAK79031.1 Hypothetical protein CA_C1055 [Clostridium acetobutylicum ATCC 824]ADZ20106.1 Conserved hypothetical protein [Clostridium acetobutylicum EA 2018]AEI31581.1 hypothetical protein SMB_G1073 [Clostridium acetobutylicum DSM 1731]AWV81713.1 hypothetical protein DK921_16785 [Clostridium acetobutylicum]MBC2395255.1 hypothetical protein [Clostridium acetobutylicum]
MNNKEILEFMVDEGISNLEEINYSNDIFIIKFHYNFDEYEIKAARAFADGECNKNENRGDWYSKYYLPFLNDIARDNVEAMVDDCMDEFSLKAECLIHDIKDEEAGYSEAIAAFSEVGNSFDIETVAKAINF